MNSRQATGLVLLLTGAVLGSFYLLRPLPRKLPVTAPLSSGISPAPQRPSPWKVSKRPEFHLVSLQGPFLLSEEPEAAHIFSPVWTGKGDPHPGISFTKERRVELFSRQESADLEGRLGTDLDKFLREVPFSRPHRIVPLRSGGTTGLVYEKNGIVQIYLAKTMMDYYTYSLAGKKIEGVFDLGTAGCTRLKRRTFELKEGVVSYTAEPGYVLVCSNDQSPSYEKILNTLLSEALHSCLFDATRRNTRLLLEDMVRLGGGATSRGRVLRSYKTMAEFEEGVVHATVLFYLTQKGVPPAFIDEKMPHYTQQPSHHFVLPLYQALVRLHVQRKTQPWILVQAYQEGNLDVLNRGEQGILEYAKGQR